MINETDTVRLYCLRSEAHARKALKATRHAMAVNRAEINRAEERIRRNLADLNEAKRVMYERGWTEE